jgi:hypothetical protein
MVQWPMFHLRGYCSLKKKVAIIKYIRHGSLLFGTSPWRILLGPGADAGMCGLATARMNVPIAKVAIPLKNIFPDRKASIQLTEAVAASMARGRRFDHWKNSGGEFD